MTEAVIEIKNLSTAFSGKSVHRGLNLAVHRGEILALVGGSGSGKTVLLRVMIALMRGSGGSVRVLGHELTNISASALMNLQARWGVLFQQNALFSSLTVLKNVVFPLRELTQLENDMIQRLAMLKLVQAGLSPDVAGLYPAELSGGMQKRAALARAIVMDPELLFLDEPTAGLDPGRAAAFDRLILDLQAMLGLTIVMITHDLQGIRRTANRVAFLGEGKILSVGTLAEVMQQPHSLIQTFFAER